MIVNQEEKINIINKKITECYPKMLRDSIQICGDGASKWADDLLGLVIETFLCEKSIDYQYKVAIQDNKLLNWMGSVMALYLKSSTSPFWNKYRRESYNYRGTYLAEYIEKENKPIDFTSEIMDDEFDTPMYLKNELDFIYWGLEQLTTEEKHFIEDMFFNKLKFPELHKKHNIPLGKIRTYSQTLINKLKNLK